jgi:hypothetical protein
MPCSLTRSDVSNLVLEVIRKKENGPNISESTRFWEDLRVDPEARRGYFRPIKTKVEAAGCTLSKVSPQDFEDAKNVKEIVEAVWADVKVNE